METLANTATDVGGAAPPPPSTSEELTPGERAYFESRGEDASGLDFGDVTPPGKTPAPVANEGQEIEAQPGEYDPDEVTLDANGKPRTKDGKFVKAVPHSVFHAKNEKLKAIAAELAAARAETAAERERMIRADERLAVLNGALAGTVTGKDAQPNPNDPIDPTKDIFGAFAQAMAKIKELEARTTQIDEKHTVARTEQQRLANFKVHAEQFMQTTPDFTSAFEHLAKGRHAELELAGITDYAQREAIIGRDARALVAQAEKEGKNPAQRLYEVAKARGYQPRAKEEPKDPASSEAAKALARTNAGQAASVTLGNSGGASTEKIGLAELANMSETQFLNYRDKYIAKHGAGAWRAYLGGS